MNLTQIAKIARREYLARVRNRAFITVTIMVPAFMALYIVAMPAMTRSGRTSLRLAIVDAGTGLGPALMDRLKAVERPQITIVEVAASAAAVHRFAMSHSPDVRRQTAARWAG